MIDCGTTSECISKNGGARGQDDSVGRNSWLRAVLDMNDEVCTMWHLAMVAEYIVVVEYRVLQRVLVLLK